MPDNYKLAKQLTANFLPENTKVVEIDKAKGKTSKYRLTETEAKYKNHSCKFAVIYSEQLEESKQKTCQKKVAKEKKRVKKSLKKYNTRSFKCQVDAEKEIELLDNKLISKLKFHTIDFSIRENKIRRPGKPSKNPENDIARIEYQLTFEINLNNFKVEEYIRKQCTFILASNDLSISGEQILKEYKTQSQVEKSFRNLKSPKYMNLLFLKNPKRVEAVVYLLLIALMLLTIAEKVVRKGLKKTNDLVIGIDRRKLKQPTLKSILQIINRVRVITYKVGENTHCEIRELDESCKKIIKFIGLNENYFVWSKNNNFT